MRLDNDVEPRVVPKQRRSAVLIPTNLPDDDPRDISERAVARFKTGIELARKLREDMNRANVLVAVFGGWPLHNRLPLAIHHVYAAAKIHKFMAVDELDFVISQGVNSVTDLHGLLIWMNENLLQVQDAYVISSTGHAERLIAESDMQLLFERTFHVESNEPRYWEHEDELWSTRARDIPPHQYLNGGRGSDVDRFGSEESFEWATKMRTWADANPVLFDDYMKGVWELVYELEEQNVVVRCHTPGCWRISINS